MPKGTGSTTRRHLHPLQQFSVFAFHKICSSSGRVCVFHEREVSFWLLPFMGIFGPQKVTKDPSLGGGTFPQALE